MPILGFSVIYLGMCLMYVGKKTLCKKNNKKYLKKPKNNDLIFVSS